MPYTIDQVHVHCTTIDDWAILQCGFQGDIDNHYPKHPLIGFFKEHPVIFPKITSNAPILGTPNVFTDGPKEGCGAYMVDRQEPVQLQFQPGSPQLVELEVVVKVLRIALLPSI